MKITHSMQDMKMNELLSNNIVNVPFVSNINVTENYYWNIIEDIKWYYLSRDYGYEANDKVAEYLIERKYSVEEIANLHNFIVNQREIIKNFIHAFLRGCPKHEKEMYKLGDDGTWDLSSHIVGMGKQMMDLVLGNPELIFTLQKIKVENFEYGFDKAIYELNEKNE